MVDLRLILQVVYFLICVVGTLCLISVMYNFIKSHFLTTVNCWFCNVHSKVPFKVRNEWFCMHCQQFNGFTKDGDYIKILPQQHNEFLNPKTFSPSNNQYVFNANGLCKICNANQELKIKQLAMYVPFRESNYDEEIEVFKKKLEKSYKLCENCENVVKKTLFRKSLLLPSFHTVNERTINDSKCEDTSRKYSIMRNIGIVLYGILFFVVVVLFANFFGAVKPIFEYRTIYSPFLQLHNDCHSALNVAFIVFVGIFTWNIFENWHFPIGILATIFAFMVKDDLIFSFKVLVICATMLFLVVRSFLWPENTGHSEMRDRCRSYVTVETNKPQQQQSTLPAALFENGSLCGKLSDLNLGINFNKGASKTPKQSYLFKPNKIIVQPAKLRVNDFYSSDNTVDTPRISPTVSSGFESNESFSYKNTSCSASISEFDSISQVNVTVIRDTLLTPLSYYYNQDSSN